MSCFAPVSVIKELSEGKRYKTDRKQPTKAGEHLKVIVKKNRLFSI